jgi:hypothetical protein
MNGIQIKYAVLLRLSVEQLFYQNRLYKQNKTQPQLDILLVPTHDCLSVMNRLNMIFKNTDVNSGFVVLARVSGTNGLGNDLIKFPARKDEVLSFLMILKNPNAINFNDLPVQPSSSNVYYFNNEVNDLLATRNDLHLSKDAAGVDGTNDSIKTSTENYRFHHIAAVAQGAAKVKHILSGQFVEPTLIVNQGGQSDLTFNLSALPMGKCELLINNISQDQFYYLEKYAGQKVFGIIELSLASTLTSNYRIIEADKSLVAQKPFYSITFINRKTTWRYRIQLQNTSPLFLEMAALSPADKTDFISKLNIVTNDTTITFSKDTVTDNEFVFVSDNPLLLQEKYFSSTSLTHDPLNLTLKKYITDATKEAAVKSNLPFPQTGSIDASALPKIYSDIFLTL